MSFEEKAVIVTGASSGIGRATAEAFAAAGASLVVVGRDYAALEDVARAVRKSGRDAVACAADVTAADAPQGIVAAAVEAFGGIDVLVNAAGALVTGVLADTTDLEWDTMLALNLTAPFRLMRAAASHLADRKGSIVNVSSVN